jgi:hypothetical protein
MVCSFAFKSWLSSPLSQVNAALHAAARRVDHHAAGKQVLPIHYCLTTCVPQFMTQLLHLFVHEWGGSPTEATAMAELRFAGGGGSSSSAVHNVWNGLSKELQLSPAVASMCDTNAPVHMKL